MINEILEVGHTFNRGNRESITKNFPQALEATGIFDINEYTFKGSAGMPITHTPWCSVFDKRITNKASEGYYIAYIFSKDMESMYVMLILSGEHVKARYKDTDGESRRKLKIIANNMRETINYDMTVFDAKVVNLNSPRSSVARSYEAAFILGKKYDLHNLPSEAELRTHLGRLKNIYNVLVLRHLDKSVGETFDYYLAMEEIDDARYQNSIENSQAANTTPGRKEPQQEYKNGKWVWKRDPAIAKEGLEKAGFICEFDNSHATFLSKKTKENFVEAHHLIPMRYQDVFSKSSLDVPANIVSLCPNCHRKIHHAEPIVRQEMAKKLLGARARQLKDFFIEIEEEELLKYYK